MSDHTKGPWLAGTVYPQRKSAGCDIAAESGENIGLVYFDKYDTPERICKANACLIAAAPTMWALAQTTADAYTICSVVEPSDDERSQWLQGTSDYVINLEAIIDELQAQAIELIEKTEGTADA